MAPVQGAAAAPQKAPVKRNGASKPAKSAAPAKPAAKPVPKLAAPTLTPAQQFDKDAEAIMTRLAALNRQVGTAHGAIREPAKAHLKKAFDAFNDAAGSMQTTRNRVKSGYAALPKVSNFWSKISLEAGGLYLRDAGRHDLAVVSDGILADWKKLQIPQPPAPKR
jgi:hypothetical protein